MRIEFITGLMLPSSCFIAIKIISITGCYPTWVNQRDLYQDRVCCVGGIPDSGQFDTVLVVDVDEEFESVIGQGDEMLQRCFC